MSPINNGISAEAFKMTRTPADGNTGRIAFGWSAPVHPQHL